MNLFNLYGNIIVDRILKYNNILNPIAISSYQRLGGLVNLLKGIDLENNHFNVYSYGDNHVLKDKEGWEFLTHKNINLQLIDSVSETAEVVVLNSNKSSVVDWQDVPLNIKVEDWTHISYFDSINISTLVKPSRGGKHRPTLSIDLCGKTTDIRTDLLEHVDFLITSEKEYDQYPTGFFEKFGITTVVHSKRGTKVDNSIFVDYNKVVDSPNNLIGVGDAYCAFFITNYNRYARYGRQRDLEDLILDSHNNAWEYINEEI